MCAIVIFGVQCTTQLQLLHFISQELLIKLIIGQNFFTYSLFILRKNGFLSHLHARFDTYLCVTVRECETKISEFFKVMKTTGYGLKRILSGMVEVCLRCTTSGGCFY